MGSEPETGHMVKEAGFDLLVLCAEEFQPPASLFPGVKIIHAPLDDTDIRFRPHDEATARSAAKRVADAMRAGSKVLVVCSHVGGDGSSKPCTEIPIGVLGG